MESGVKIFTPDATTPAPKRDAVPHRTLERRLPLQLESRLTHRLG